jgi:GMP synthase (glutamine-hydrolysing)
MRVLLLDCFVEGDGAQAFLPWLAGAQVLVRRPVHEPLDVRPGEVDAVVVGGSPASAADSEPWIVGLSDWLRAAVEADVPVLGCCFGHQMLARAWCGPEAVARMAVAEVSFPEVTALAPDPLLTPLGARFRVFASHEDEVLPHPDLQVLAASADCPVHAIRIPGRRAWGVQFHVEYPDLEVDRILRYRAERHPELQIDPETLGATRPDTRAHARALFGTFLRLASEG